ncbi:hypothetical protein EVA_08952 [gut metagenome]|uniref:Uncharacterized protein n=1 Tax=gut metagenome TaxID=749906 RepID=J9GL95_9ZZZZ
MSKHLTFKQAFRNSSQINFDKRILCTPAINMYSLSNQFLTRATFSCN